VETGERGRGRLAESGLGGTHRHDSRRSRLPDIQPPSTLSNMTGACPPRRVHGSSPHVSGYPITTSTSGRRCLIDFDLMCRLSRLGKVDLTALVCACTSASSPSNDGAVARAGGAAGTSSTGGIGGMGGCPSTACPRLSQPRQQVSPMRPVRTQHELDGLRERQTNAVRVPYSRSEGPEKPKPRRKERTGPMASPRR